MEMLRNCLLIGAGGACGSMLRYLFSLLPVKHESGFPLTTLGINVIGAFIIGLLVAVSAKNENFSPSLLLFLKIGICGGFTTFSAFALESAELLKSGSFFVSGVYMTLSVLLCVVAVIGAQSLVG